MNESTNVRKIGYEHRPGGATRLVNVLNHKPTYIIPHYWTYLTVCGVRVQADFTNGPICSRVVPAKGLTPLIEFVKMKRSCDSPRRLTKQMYLFLEESKYIDKACTLCSLTY